jgi:AmmeMemoRadiSam system protein A
MVPLWFILQKYTDFRLVRIGLSGLPLADHYRFGEIINDAVSKIGRRVVFVASGDLSHKLKEDGPYGFAPEGPGYDYRIMDVCGRAAFGELFDFDESFCRKAAECGHRSFVIMAGALDGMKIRVEKLSHQDVTGVGYGLCMFHPEGKDEGRHFLDAYLKKVESEIEAVRKNGDDYVKLARKSLESYVLHHKTISIPEGLPSKMLSEKAGAFVSVHKLGELRGCIGTIAPTTSCIAKEIINNAISAAVSDSRFDPIRPDELKWLEINVDVLTPAEDISSPDELDVKKYGVIVTCGRRRGLLLPDLEGVDTVEEQISIALKKGGIRPDENYSLQRFEVVRHI